tara:strand:+ start:682484 stop:683989 length:1506 start_codon:yes stop_codon:yes gene_type:complete
MLTRPAKASGAGLLIYLGWMLVIGTTGAHADWPQWRGPERNGYIDSVALVEQLPSDGIKPEWTIKDFDGGTSGGWSSPVISDGKVYLYAHTKTKNPDLDPGEAKYPWIAPDKRGGMTDQEYEEYEVKRRDENERRAKAFRFDERLLCVDLESGETVWDRSLECVYTRFTQSSTPCVANGRVFVLGPKRTARCYEASTGEVVWEQQLPGEFRDEFFASSFLVAGDVALVSCGPLTALSANDGTILWQGDTSTNYQSHSSPAIWSPGDSQHPEHVVFANTSGGKTKAYRLSDGHKLWQLNSGTGQSTPIVAGNLLLTYGSSRKSGLTAYQLDPAAPERQPDAIWQFQRAADSGSTPVVCRDAVFVQGEKRLAKVDLASGDTVWQTTLKISNPRYTSLVAAGDQVFYGWEGLLAFAAEPDRFTAFYDAEVDSKGRLIGADDLREELKISELSSEDDGLAKAEKLWKREAISSGPLACSSPAIDAGRIVLRLKKGIVCYDLRAQK